MIAIGKRSLAEVRRRAIKVVDDTFHKSEWMETTTGPSLSPTVFLAEQPPHCRLLTHFHRQNQFQLFVEGKGSLGKEPIGPGTVHYAGAYTGYGPLLSGAQGLKYFTIRSVFDTGFIAASEAHEKMVRGPKRHAQVGLGAPWDIGRLKALDEPQRLEALPADRGLAVIQIRLPPDTPWPLGCIAGSVGQFVFVLAGSARLVGSELLPWESAFVSSAEAGAFITSNCDGAEFVTLHMPQTEPEYLPAQPAGAIQ